MEEVIRLNFNYEKRKKEKRIDSIPKSGDLIETILIKENKKWRDLK